MRFLIAFIKKEFTEQLRSGTLVLSLTKGLERYKIVISKTVMITVLWSICYWMCFGTKCSKYLPTFLTDGNSLIRNSYNLRHRRV